MRATVKWLNKQNGKKMIALSNETKDLISRSVGISFNDMERMSASDIDKVIEKKINKKLEVSPKKNDCIHGIGSVYLALRRFVSFKNINEKLKKIR